MFVKDMIFMISFKGLAPSELNSLPNRVPVLKALPAKDTGCGFLSRYCLFWGTCFTDGS